MELKYRSEILEDQLYREFYSDTNEYWSQREQPGIRDFIKWAIIKGYLKEDDTTITVHDCSVMSTITTPNITWNNSPTPIRDIMVNGKIGDVPNNPYEIKC